MAWWNLLDLVVDKSGAADAISQRIEHKDGAKSGKANRIFQLLLIGWATFALYIYYISNVQSDPSGAGAISTLSVLCPFIPLLLVTSIYMMWLLSD
ncbi:hypothetical protein N8771_03020 [Euryarchaeota archaeon]|nr:hypothetical protein [Euryarchaeota archaeon]|tara:strand:+ start:155 stop:442 length:288 start_codon:yes stop_codon:yes gene_type:complete